VKVLREKWPDCRTFKGVESYFAEATGPLRDRQRHEQRRLEEQQQAEAESRRRREQEERQAELERLWESLAEDEREEIRAVALRGHPTKVLSRREGLAHALCLAELRRRQEGDAPREV
jgi:acyl-CoA reductase-like NAD-dependent aldehyde dehydrogenase